AADVICNGLPSRAARLTVARRVGGAFSVPAARVAHLLDVSKPAMSSSGGTVRRVAHLLDVSKPAMSSSGGTVRVGRVLLPHAIPGGARQGAAELARERTTTLSETLISMQVGSETLVAR
ncbi:hypothetical protein T484DRAFT_1830405, partial [Baffinella frigidus]